MANIENLTKRNGPYYVRKRVPDDLIELIGKRELKKSLRTKGQKEALKLFSDVLSEIEAELEGHRVAEVRPSRSDAINKISERNLKKVYTEKYAMVQAVELNLRERVLVCLKNGERDEKVSDFHPPLEKQHHDRTDRPIVIEMCCQLD